MRQTIDGLRKKKQNGEPIVMVTAYDYPMAHAAEQAGVDALLVGDSLGTAVLGYESTLPVTLEDMIHHARAVCRAAKKAHVVVDMPFLTYQISPEEALRNAGRLIQETGCQSVKLEGGRASAPTIRRLVETGIPVMGHLGLTPQSIHQLSGYRVQGKQLEAARNLWEDALALVDAGVYAIVLECVPGKLAESMASRLPVPLIGIGAGAGCDGQVLVLHDLIGLTVGERIPRFVKQFADMQGLIRQAVASYGEEVRLRQFPAQEHTYTLDEEVLQQWLAWVDRLPGADLDDAEHGQPDSGR